jgi:hypothetical protein
MHIIIDKLYNLGTYAITLTGIITNFETIKSTILFVGGIVLLILQIRLHLLKIKNVSKKDKEEKE